MEDGAALVSLETRRGALAAVWQHGRWELVQCGRERGGDALRMERLFMVQRVQRGQFGFRSVVAQGRLLRAMPDSSAAHCFADWSVEESSTWTLKKADGDRLHLHNAHEPLKSLRVYVRSAVAMRADEHSALQRRAKKPQHRTAQHSTEAQLDAELHAFLDAWQAKRAKLLGGYESRSDAVCGTESAAKAAAAALRAVRAESSDAAGAPYESFVRCQASVETPTVICSGTAEECRGAEGGAGMTSVATRDGEGGVTTAETAGARVQHSGKWAEAGVRDSAAHRAQGALERHVSAAAEVQGGVSGESRWREPAQFTQHVERVTGAVAQMQAVTGGEARGGRRRAPPRTLADATWLCEDAAAVAAGPSPSTRGVATHTVQVVTQQRTAPRRLAGVGGGGGGGGNDGDGTADAPPPAQTAASATQLKPTMAPPPSPGPPLAMRRAEGAVAETAAAAAAAAGPRWRLPSASQRGKSARPPAPPHPPPPPPPPPPAWHLDDKENTGGHDGHNAASGLGQRASARGALFDQIKTMNYTLKSVIGAEGKARRSHLRQGMESETDDDWE